MTGWAFLDHHGPIAFAHRGGALDAPENSMQAFHEAHALGYRYMETDVHVTADGEVVAFHDPSLDRVTDRSGLIREKTYAEVGEARIDGRAPIPLLREVLEALPDIRVNIDPKHDTVAAPLADLIVELGAVDRVCVSSFSDRRNREIANTVGPALCTGMGPRSVAALRMSSMGLPTTQGQGVCAQVPTKYGPVPVVTRRFVDHAHELGRVVHVWTIDDPAEMHRLLDLGVDGLMTDRPSVLRDVFVDRGLPWPAVV